MKIITKSSEEAFNVVLSKLKYSPGAKMLIGDANKITGCSSQVIEDAFKLLSEETGVNMAIERRKMVFNKCNYHALYNIEPINPSDAKKIKYDPTVNLAPANTWNYGITGLKHSYDGLNELTLFTVVYKNRFFYTKNNKIKGESTTKTGDWMCIEDYYGRRFITVRPDLWHKDSKRCVFNANPEVWHYGRIKISENTTKYEPDLLYVNIYDCAPIETALSREIQEKYRDLVHIDETI